MRRNSASANALNIDSSMLPPSVSIRVFQRPRKRIPMRNKILLAALASTLIVSACGLKGPLYLPQPPAAGADHSKEPPVQAPTR
ncbi:hypothetical protein B4966_00730 [Rhodocyclaceae bacterium]|nr:hypothetical protein B4966_00730 [Rhodocyclaceae bacterium]